MKFVPSSPQDKPYVQPASNFQKFSKIAAARIDSEPEFARPEILKDGAHASHMVRMSVCDRHHIKLMYVPRP